jgi:hypothetical protein
MRDAMRCAREGKADRAVVAQVRAMQSGNSQVPYNPFGGGGGANPFDVSSPSTVLSKDPSTPVGFMAEGTDRSRLLDSAEADVVLRRFDREQRDAAGAYGKTVVRPKPCSS